MKDVRCVVGRHKWQRRQIEDSRYLACTRCGRERNTVPTGPLGGGMGGLAG